MMRLKQTQRHDAIYTLRRTQFSLCFEHRPEPTDIKVLNFLFERYANDLLPVTAQAYNKGVYVTVPNVPSSSTDVPLPEPIQADVFAMIENIISEASVWADQIQNRLSALNKNPVASTSQDNIPPQE